VWKWKFGKCSMKCLLKGKEIHNESQVQPNDTEHHKSNMTVALDLNTMIRTTWKREKTKENTNRATNNHQRQQKRKNERIWSCISIHYSKKQNAKSTTKKENDCVIKGQMKK
jgi:hypothetical protein